MIWFSSDFHLGHTNIVGPKVSHWKDGFRTFDSIKEMDNTIIDTVNKYVKWGDTLYYLGDFCLGNIQKVQEYRARLLIETIHMMKGNHDKWCKTLTHGTVTTFDSIQDVLKITQDKTTIFMSHYAHRVWPHSHKGCIHLYGHSHGNIEDHGKSMDVGVDVAYKMFGEYRPFSFDEIVRIMSKKTVSIVDHHNNDTNE